MVMDATDRFMSHVDVKDENSCWEWVGHLDAKGYGRFWFEGRQGKAHRWCYQHLVAEIPPGLMVRHACDNPPCVNPRHLLVGNAAMNTADMMARGRARKRTGLMPSKPSQWKNFSRDGSKVVSFWLHPPEIAFLDQYAEENTGGNRTEAVRVLIRDAEKRNGRKRK